MKRLVFLSSLLIAMMCAVVSCSKNNGPTPTPVKKTILKTWTIPIKGLVSPIVTLTPTTIKLSDIPEVDVNNFISGTFQNLNNTIEISGLKDGVLLNNFTLQVNNITPANNFGTVTTKPGTNDFQANAPQALPSVSKFAESLFNAYTGKSQTATLNVTFTPNVDILPTDNVNLIITVNGDYNWNTFPNN